MELICIDLEASGLSIDSYPIEIAWKNAATGEQDGFLINPSSVDGWSHWDECAEEVHGIEPELLEADGIGAWEACRRLSAALADRQVVCDAYEYDLFWLTRLFDSQGLSLPFQLRGLEAVLTSEQLILYRLHSKTSVRRHRALEDVEDLIRQIRAIQAGAD